MHLEQKITPFLTFKDQAEEAARFYVSVLPDSKIVRTIANPATGAVMMVELQLAGMNFATLNTGQSWEFTEAFSLGVGCDSQAEIDDLWSKLTAGGSEVQCGWLKDKFGVAWQIYPANIGELIGGNDAERSGRVMSAVMQMVKLDMDELQRAYDGV